MDDHNGEVGGWKGMRGDKSNGFLYPRGDWFRYSEPLSRIIREKSPKKDVTAVSMQTILLSYLVQSAVRYEAGMGSGSTARRQPSSGI